MYEGRPIAIPAEADAALTAAQGCLGDALVAAYLHGSAISGGLHPDSDVDVMLIVDRPIADAARRGLLDALLELSGRPGTDDPGRPLEVIVFDTGVLAASGHPHRSEFVFGEWLRGGFEAGALPEPHRDVDHTILLAHVRQRALPLCGPEAHLLLPEIPDTDLRRAIGEAARELPATMQGDERNALLTLARMWYTLQTGGFAAKDVAAAWAASRLDADARALMTEARLAYLGHAADNWHPKRALAQQAARTLVARIASLA